MNAVSDDRSAVELLRRLQEPPGLGGRVSEQQLLLLVPAAENIDASLLKSPLPRTSSTSAGNK